MHFWQRIDDAAMRDSSGKTDASSPRSAGFARGSLTVRPRKAEP
ncbi:hypothetical protein [Salicibibacter cibi]|nr:hypothetical protein [Salicibibacter cibi]